MPLTDVTVKKAVPKEKRYMLSDSRGLYLEIMPTGKKCWRLRYFSDGKEKKVTIGIYPDLSLHDARVKTEEARHRVAIGESLIEKPKRNFRIVAEEWLSTRIIPVRSENHVRTIMGRLNRHVFPVIGDMPIERIVPQDILSICRKLEAIGTIETAHKIKQIIGQVMRYAIATGEITTDPTYSLQGALRSHKPVHMATITDKEKIPHLVRTIASYPQTIVRIATQFSVLTFARPGEVRNAEWNEINWERHEWNIPAEKMKMRRPHLVPLSAQAMKLLEDLRPMTGDQKWLFPSTRRDGRPMSDGTVRMALRAMGYEKNEISPHGFRAMASTILNGQRFPIDIIEFQLAHSSGDPVREAYNHAQYLDERRIMMQWWADWLNIFGESNPK